MKKKLRSEFNSRQYMLARDFEVFYYSDLHFSSVGRHSHDYTEVYLFCEGEVDMEIAGVRRALRPGDVLLHGHTHVAACEVREGYTYCNPGSVALPKGGEAPGYMTLGGTVLTWKTLATGAVLRALTL